MESGRGWFTGSLGEAEAMTSATMGAGFLFGEQRPRELFQEVGVNVRAVKPGQPTALYHSEQSEETFLVLGGECVAVVDDQEIVLRKWDFLHCPPGTPHVLVGAGDGLCHILMVGGRTNGPGGIHYPVSEVAGRYGASVERATDDPRDAWQQAGFTMDFELRPLPWPPA